MWRRSRRLLAFGWPSWLSSRRVSPWGIAVGLLLLAIIPVAIAQSLRRAPSLQSATRAYFEGRYDEVAGLLTDLDQDDPIVVALKGRALIARGRYDEAEQILRPSVQRRPAGEAALELGLLLQKLGRPDATAILTPVAVGPTGNEAYAKTVAARAMRALGYVRDANDAYRDAAAIAPTDPMINTGWGELFLETHNNAEAAKSFRMALEADEKYTPALIGSARALAEDNPPQAVAAAQAVLKINPSDVEAHVFLASQAIDAGKRDEGRELLQKALVVNPQSLEAHALLAGLAYVEDKNPEFEAEVGKVLVVAPRNAEVYRVAGELAARNYRFDEAVVLTRKALDLEPRNPRVLVDLGIHLLRTGDEPAARQVLDTAFKIDPFNVVTFNLLQMMDQLQTFVTIEDGNIILRMSKDEVPVLRDYAVDLAHRALNTLSARYQFEVKGPILIEMFPKHDDFAVRNVGLPGMIGALGACFGRVVTLDSPKARPPGDFQWEATLWHELAHVVTIQMSNWRVPRWLTEGISVYEETLARKTWGRGMDVEFAGLLNEKQTLPLKDLNEAFQSPQTISLAYYEASLLVEHLVSRFGDEGLHKLLRAYGQGLDTDAALKSALDTDFDQLQITFDAAMEKRFGAIQAALRVPNGVVVAKTSLDVLRPLAVEHPESYPIQFAFGSLLRQTGDVDGAVQALERAARLIPIATGENSPQLQLADIAIERKDSARAMTALQAVLDSDFDNLDAARQLASLMREGNITDPVRLRPVYERIAALNPFESEAHSVLGRLAMDRNEPETAVREFRTVIALRPVDQAAAHTDLAESYFKVGRRVEARRETLAALEIAPSYERAQDLLLRLSEARP